MVEKFDIKQLRYFAMTKRLNFLIGSGTSVPAIPLISLLLKKDIKGIAGTEVPDPIRKLSLLVIAK